MVKVLKGRENGLGVFRWVVGKAKMVRASEKKRKKIALAIGRLGGVVVEGCG